MSEQLTKVNMMNQPTMKQQVLSMLELDVVCATTFWERHMPSARNRVSELRAEGYNIHTETCTNTRHQHRGHTIQYRLLPADTRQTTLDLGGT